MPLYGLTSSKKISNANKQKIANLFTDAHCSIMIAPEQFVHVIFSEGIPLIANKSLYVHANVRLGRSETQMNQLCQAIIKGCAEILQIKEDKIHINLMEIPGKWAMEGGHVMPDPGEEDEWMEKVTNALANRKSTITQV
jgi:phenylpyruvate tautomerase PptA (4-oxalocrotonate tautomerase family)